MPISLVLFLAFFSFGKQPYPGAGVKIQQVQFQAKDGVNVYADWAEVEKSEITVILFHQAGSNARGEYITILPELTQEGYSVLAVDQRSGGNKFGFFNRTNDELGKDYDYCEAYPDLRAAADYISKNGPPGKVVIWGSSYSAGLLFQLASEKPSLIDGLVACSPASSGPMEPCDPGKYMSQVKCKAIVFRPKKEMQYQNVKDQLEKAKSFGFQTYIAENGVHGSSMFVEDRTESSTGETWDRLWKFLKELE